VVAVAVEPRLGAARAEDDVRVPEVHDVFGGGDELVERAEVHAALEQHDGVTAGDGLADLAEQRIIQGVAGADLQDVHPRVEREPELLLIHHLGVHRQAGAARTFHQDVERLVVTLEGVGIGPGFPHAAAQRLGAGLLHRVRRLIEIIRVLRIDGAEPGHDEQLVAEGHAAHLHAVVREVGLDVHELVRRLDGVDAVDERQTLEPADHQLVALVADDGVDGAHRADDRLDAAAEFGDDGGQLGDFLGREAVVLGQDHGGVGLENKRAARWGGSVA
jgi:hypothetical protein